MEQTNPVQVESVTLVAPAVNQPPVSPKKSNKSFLVILLAILGLILAGGLVYAGVQIGKKQSLISVSPTPMPTEVLIPTIPISTPTPDPTAGWKTYTNKKYGYSISYPINWDVKEFPESGGYIEVTSLNPDKVTDRISAIFITVSPNPYEVEATGNGDPIKVGNFTAKKKYGGAPPNATGVYLRVVAPLGTKSIIFESNTDYEPVFDQILSTFRFD